MVDICVKMLIATQTHTHKLTIYLQIHTNTYKLNLNLCNHVYSFIPPSLLYTVCFASQCTAIVR